MLCLYGEAGIRAVIPPFLTILTAVNRTVNRMRNLQDRTGAAGDKRTENMENVHETVEFGIFLRYNTGIKF